MDIPSFARYLYRSGERDANAAARKYLEEALASEDPLGALISAVTCSMGDEFRRQRRTLQDLTPQWDAPRSGRMIVRAAAGSG